MRSMKSEGFFTRTLNLVDDFNFRSMRLFVTYFNQINEFNRFANSLEKLYSSVTYLYVCIFKSSYQVNKGITMNMAKFDLI